MNPTPRLNCNGIIRAIENGCDGLEAYDNWIRYRAQSILTLDGAPGPLLSIEQARDVVAWHERHLQLQVREPGWGFGGTARALPLQLAAAA